MTPSKRRKVIKTKQENRKIPQENIMSVRKQDEFETYLIWRSLPSLLKGLPTYKIQEIGITNNKMISLLRFKTQEEFAKAYKIREATLSEWNKTILDNDSTLKYIVYWAKGLTPNIIFALYKSAVESGKASEIIAWVKIVEGWREKSEEDINRNEELKEVLERVRGLLPR